MEPVSLKETFLAEADELISDLESGLIVLESSPTASDAINQIFRSAHTLKSGAGMVGIEAMVRLAHVAENVLALVRDRSVCIDRDLISTLLAFVDSFKNMLSLASRGVPVNLDPSAQRTIERLKGYLDPKKRGTGTSSARNDTELRVFRIELSFAPTLFTTGPDPSLLLTDLAELATIVSNKPYLDDIPEFELLDPERCYIGFCIIVRTERPLSDIEGVFLFLDANSTVKITDVTRQNSHLDGLAHSRLGELLVEEGCVATQQIEFALKQQKRLGEVLVELGAVEATTVDRVLATQRGARQVRRAATIRVDTEKLDRLVNLVGELAITISHVHQNERNPEATSAARIAAVEALEQIGRELQSQVMAVRMVPIEESFGRFKRMVRDLAQDLGKHAVLETYGTDTEIDKTVSEQLADPLKHMVRNAIAHGLETPKERLAAGKPDTGRIQLRAEQRQGHVVIEVTDDGRGIDLDRVFEKAKQRGLVSGNEKLTDRQLYDFLFHPGFSTAEAVNEISGRGVGLDVVKKNVTDLRGDIEVESQRGQGTVFRIRLPLTLAIIEGMNVRVGSDTMTIPMTSVVELVSPRSHRISTVEGRGELVDVRGSYLPVVRLSEVLDCAAAEAKHSDPVVVVVENEGRRFGILVDRVLGLDQTVVKPLAKAFNVVRTLDRSYRKLDGVSGATILPDGNIALILDVPGIERMAFGGVQ